MTWNFTLSVVLPSVADGWGQWDTAYVGKLRVGTPISVRPYMPLKPVNISSHQGFAHVQGVPDTISAESIRERLTGPYMDDATPPSMIERVEWLFRSDVVSEAGADYFLNNRKIGDAYTPLTWEDLKAVSWSLKLGRSAIDADFV